VYMCVMSRIMRLTLLERLQKAEAEFLSFPEGEKPLIAALAI
jgi:hypothetical protein